VENVVCGIDSTAVIVEDLTDTTTPDNFIKKKDKKPKRVLK